VSDEREDLPIEERAGTRLDHAHSEKIYQKRHGTQKYCGILDRTHSVYQCGGSLSRQVYWKRKCLGVGVDEWRQISDRADWFEFIDLHKNVCYRISMLNAKQLGDYYDGEWGRRYGIPLDAFDRYDGPGLVARDEKPKKPNPPDETWGLF
jgi:hypothetical protein